MDVGRVACPLNSPPALICMDNRSAVKTLKHFQLRETTTTIGKLEYKVEKLRDKAEAVADHVADCKLELIGAKFHDEAEARNYKDTHVDLSMEMWILHNKSRDCESITAHNEYTQKFRTRFCRDFASCAPVYS